MDTVKESLAQMMDVFQSRMAEFEGELVQKSSESGQSLTSLAAEFVAFKDFITKALCSLQQQVEVLAGDVDRLEMRTRRKMLLLHGLPESDAEVTTSLVVKQLSDRLRLDVTDAAIKRCQRMGRSAGADRPRPILVKFETIDMRNKVWFSKVGFKGTGITLSEFLTKSRHDIFMAARQRFGVSKSWTRDGNIYVIVADGSRRRVASLAELSKVGAQAVQDIPPKASSKSKSTASGPIGARPKRTAAMKR